MLLKIHLKKIFLACFFLFFSTLLDFGGILVFNELLERFNNEEKEEKDTIFNLSKISLLKLIIFMITYAPITFILHFQASHIFDVISFSSQSQLKCLIFDKVLKMPTYIKTNFTQGKIINLIQSDSSKFGELITTILEVFSLPIKILYSTILLFTFYGYTVVPCFIILFLLFFLFFYFGKKQNEYENDLMEISDKRMNVLSQTFNIIKIIKLYVWEKLFIKKIEKVKEEENIIMRKKANMTLIVNSSYWNTDTLLILIIVIFYFLKYQKLDNSKIFTTMFIFYTIIDQLYCLPIIITNLNDTFISLKRIQLFLEIKEHNKNHLQYIEEESNYSIEIDGANFGVLKSQNYKEEKGQKNNKNENENENDEENDLKLLEEDNNDLIKIELLNNIKIQINKGEHIAVIGKVGSGKSCLLNCFINNLALFNEDDIINDDLRIINQNENYNHKRKMLNVSGKISYVTQNPWILNDNFRNNILFFNKFDEDKYNKIISICQLEPDL